MISSFCSYGNCVQVDPAPDGGVYVRRRVTGDGAGTAQLRFTAAEWDAFVVGVVAGEFSLERMHAEPPTPTASTAANTNRINRRRRQRRAMRQLINGDLVAPLPPKLHGRISTYINWDCRCPACRAVGSERNAAGRALRVAAQEPPKPPP